MSSYRYRLTRSAARELEQEIAYSARQWGKHHARAYRQGLQAAIEHIAATPFLHANGQNWARDTALCATKAITLSIA